MNKLEGILKTSPSVEAKAADYAQRIKEDLDRKILQPLRDEVRRLNNEVKDQLDLSLSTDVNKGILPITRPEIQARVEKAIQAKYQLSVAKMELDFNQAGFDEIFGEDEEEEAATATKRTRAPRTPAVTGKSETVATAADTTNGEPVNDGKAGY